MKVKKDILKSRLQKFIIITLIATAAFTGGYIVSPGDDYFEIAKHIDIFTRIYKEISFNYVDEVDPAEFMKAGIGGMLKALDPYTIYVDEMRQQDIELITDGKYGGIGVTIGLREGKATILEIMGDYAAERQGLMIGDIILAVDNEEINRNNYDDMSLKVKGEPGTFVDLTILRNERDTLDFELMRMEVTIKNVSYYGFYPPGSGNAYIKLRGFARPSAGELKVALLELMEQDTIKSLILDLRGNPGGLLNAAVDIADKFIEKGELIVSTKGKTKENTVEYFASQEPLLGDVPMVVLVNGRSASASEIVAGAIQDHDRGIILGQKSFGKGLVQTIITLSYNTSLKLTTARYYTPSGRCIQKVDYSDNNKVIRASDSLDNALFYTDNNRSVYGAGGITPDTLVKETEYPEIIVDLYAKGLIFRFANRFYSENPDADPNLINTDSLYIRFIKFIGESEYEFIPEIVHTLKELKEAMISDKHYAGFVDELESIEDGINLNTADLLKNHRELIIQVIQTETATRYLAHDKSIEQRLASDPQFGTALSILKDSVLYQQLLNQEDF